MIHTIRWTARVDLTLKNHLIGSHDDRTSTPWNRKWRHGDIHGLSAACAHTYECRCVVRVGIDINERLVCAPLARPQLSIRRNVDLLLKHAKVLGRRLLDSLRWSGEIHYTLVFVICTYTGHLHRWLAPASAYDCSCSLSSLECSPAWS